MPGKTLEQSTHETGQPQRRMWFSTCAFLSVSLQPSHEKKTMVDAWVGSQALSLVGLSLVVKDTLLEVRGGRRPAVGDEQSGRRGRASMGRVDFDQCLVGGRGRLIDQSIDRKILDPRISRAFAAPNIAWGQFRSRCAIF